MNNEQNQSYEDEIDLRDLLKVLWKRKVLIIFIPILCVISVFIVLSSIQKSDYITIMNISLNFVGIEKYQYPDGKSFNPKDVIAPRIVNDINGKDLNGMVFIEGIVPNYVKTKIKKNPEYQYLPNKFEVSIVESDIKIFESDDQRKDSLTEIVSNFSKQFKESYINERTLDFNFPDKFIETYEYDDIINILKQYAIMIDSFLIKKNESIGLNRLKTKGVSFSELINELKILIDIDIEGVNSKINIFNLSRDKDILIAKLKDKIERLNYDSVKDQNISVAANKILNDVKNNRTIITSDSQNSNYIPKKYSSVEGPSILNQLVEDDYIFYLIKTILDSNTNSISTKVEITKLEDKVKRLENKSENKKHDVQLLENQLSHIVQRLLDISNKANNLNIDYLNSMYADSINITSAPEFSITKTYNAKLILMLTLISSLFVSVILAFFVEYLSKEN